MRSRRSHHETPSCAGSYLKCGAKAQASEAFGAGPTIAGGTCFGHGWIRSLMRRQLVTLLWSIFVWLALFFATCARAQDSVALRRAQELTAEVVQLFQNGRYQEAIPKAREALGIQEKALGSEHLDVATSLNILAELYRAQGQHGEADPLFRRALGIREKVLGPEHPGVATSLNNLAALYWAQGRYGEAEPLFRRALGIREKALGPEHPDVAASLTNLATLSSGQGRYREAEPLFGRALGIWEKALGPEHPNVATNLTNLAELYRAEGRYEEAEPLYRRALGIREKVLGPEHPAVATSLNNFAELYWVQGRYGEAEPLFRRALGIWEKALGPEHPDVATCLTNLAALYSAQGRYGEAEPLLRRALGIWEKALGPEHPNVATSLNNLVELYSAQGRYGEAEPLLRRALGIWEKALGPEHPNVATSLTNLAELYRAEGRYGEAEPLLRRALGIREKALGPDHPDVAASLNSLAALDGAQGRYGEAEPLLRRALGIREKALGPEHPDVAASLNNLAKVYQTQGRYGEAEPLYRRALGISEKSWGPEHPHVAVFLENLALSLAGEGKLSDAREMFERSRAIRLAVRRINADSDDDAYFGLLKAELGGLWRYASVLAAIGGAPTVETSPGAAARDAFVVAEQIRGGAAAAALARAGARAAAGEPGTAELTRRAQDLKNRRQMLRKQLTVEYGKSLAQRDAGRLTALTQQSQALDNELSAATEQLRQAFPRYAELSAPEPIKVAAVERLLRPDEALVSYLTLEDRLLVWLVRPAGAPLGYWNVEIKRPEVEQLVAHVRASAELSPGQSQLKPYDVARAHRLYELLITPLEPALSGVKQLLVVPDEVLLPLPFAALVREGGGEAYEALVNLAAAPHQLTETELASYGQLSWLVQQYPITVLPSATALRALREVPRTATVAREPFLGFGDPVLRGNGRRRGGRMLTARGASETVAELRRLNRLPGTREELTTLATVLGADWDQALFLGPQATKPTVMALNSSGRLGRAEVLAFATHGLIAGEVTGVTQPALVLTPPAVASAEDDGLLSLEDILRLKLTSTEWVTLSACNTAAGDGSGEGLSGLVRAFAFAGAPALLVSHWSVEDRATQALMTEVFGRYATDRTQPRAEALRHGMLALMSQASGDTAYFAHPFAWAPFFLVGEGGSAR